MLTLAVGMAVAEFRCYSAKPKALFVRHSAVRIVLPRLRGTSSLLE